MAGVVDLTESSDEEGTSAEASEKANMAVPEALSMKQLREARKKVVDKRKKIIDKIEAWKEQGEKEDNATKIDELREKIRELDIKEIELNEKIVNEARTIERNRFLKEIFDKENLKVTAGSWMTYTNRTPIPGYAWSDSDPLRKRDTKSVQVLHTCKQKKIGAAASRTYVHDLQFTPNIQAVDIMSHIKVEMSDLRDNDILDINMAMYQWKNVKNDARLLYQLRKKNPDVSIQRGSERVAKPFLDWFNPKPGQGRGYILLYRPQESSPIIDPTLCALGPTGVQGPLQSAEDLAREVYEDTHKKIAKAFEVYNDPNKKIEELEKLGAYGETTKKILELYDSDNISSSSDSSDSSEDDEDDEDDKMEEKEKKKEKDNVDMLMQSSNKIYKKRRNLISGTSGRSGREQPVDSKQLQMELFRKLSKRQKTSANSSESTKTAGSKLIALYENLRL